MALEFRKMNSFEWCVALPSQQCARESPVFLLRGDECLFRFLLEKCYGMWFYNFYLELKSKRREFKSFPGHLQVGFKKEQTLSLDNKAFEISQRGGIWIWSFSETNLKPKLPSDYLDGNYIKFLISFDDGTKPILRNGENLDDKSVQTASYIDTNILLEGVSKDFSTLLEEGPGHDVEFICGGEAIQAHMNVLSCRSGVFSSMLRTDLVEKRTGQVKIEDMEVAHFKLFLRYLYSGVLPEMTVEVALSLYEASDKYAVDALKKQCTSFLLENVSPENACKVLIVADRHADLDFKSNMMEYMMKVKIPRIGEKWTEFCKENPSLATEVLNLIFHQFCSE